MAEDKDLKKEGEILAQTSRTRDIDAEITKTPIKKYKWNSVSIYIFSRYIMIERILCIGSTWHFT